VINFSSDTAGPYFPVDTPGSYTSETDSQDIMEMLLKLALSIVNLITIPYKQLPDLDCQRWFLICVLPRPAKLTRI
jgi:hypothetical protein